MGHRCFEVEESGGVAHVRLSRPDELNTMVPEFWSELPEVVGGLSDAGAVRCVVLSSTGKHFSAGMDLGVFPGSARDAPAEPGRANARTRLVALALQESFTALERARVPVLVAVQGGCIGGAVDLVCAADVRYASADAFFVVQEINIGMTADVGTLQRMPRLAPDGLVRELAYTGRRMGAAEAERVGFVTRVFDDAQALVAGVLDVAGEIAGKSPLALWGTKEAFRYTRDHSVPDALEWIATWQAGMFQPADMTEALTARREGRAPSYPPLPPVPRGLEGGLASG